jgi:hypothetical protein
VEVFYPAWAEIIFGQEIEFDYYLDYDDLIDDESLSMERDQITRPLSTHRTTQTK